MRLPRAKLLELTLKATGSIYTQRVVKNLELTLKATGGIYTQRVALSVSSGFP